MSQNFSNIFISKVQCLKSFESDKSKAQNYDDEELEHTIDRIFPSKDPNVWTLEPIKQCKESFSIVFSSFKLPNSGDITVQIDGEKFHCQMLILKCYSKFFHERSRSEKKIILNSKYVQVDVFCAIYEWMISRDKIVKRDGLVRLLIGAEYLQVTALASRCWDFIQNLQWFKEDQAYLLYVEARAHNYKSIQILMLKEIKKFFLTFVSSHDYDLLNVSEVIVFLLLDNIGLNLEIDAFYAAAKWLLFDWQERKKHLIDVMKCIRFGLLDSWMIVVLRKNENCKALKDMLNNQELQKMLEDAMSYSIYRSCFEQTDFLRFQDFLTRFKFDQVFERKLIVDPYWQEWYADTKYSYDDFLKYLKILETSSLTHWNSFQFKSQIKFK